MSTTLSDVSEIVSRIVKLADERDEARAEVARLTRERDEAWESGLHRLAACSTAALSDTPASFARLGDDLHPDFASPAYDDVRRRVAECITLRAEVARLTRERDEARRMLGECGEHVEEVAGG